MNARFGGGYPFSHLAGVNLPKAIITWLTGEQLDVDVLKERIGVLGQRILRLSEWRAKYNMKTYAVYVSGKATRIRKAILKYNELANAIKCVISDEAFDIELQDFFSLYNIAYYAFDYNGKEKILIGIYCSLISFCMFLMKNRLTMVFHLGAYIKGKIISSISKSFD